MRPTEASGDDLQATRASATVAPWEFDLQRLIAETAEPLTAAAVEKGLAIQVMTAPTVPAAVAGDADGVRDVLAALLGNAVRFTESGEVVASVTSHRAGNGRAVVRFEISDTGPGIPPEALDGGAGGGLARSRALVERMDGRLDCGTAAGLGSTLSFALPLDVR